MNPGMNVIQYIKTLLANGEIQPAIQKMNEVAPSTYQENEAIDIAFRFSMLMQSSSSMDTDKLHREKSHLVSRINEVLERMKDQLLQNEEIMGQQYAFTPPTNTPTTADNASDTPSQVSKILFMSANPAETTVLRLSNEMREIQNTLKKSRNRDDFQFIMEPQVNNSIIRQRIKEERPEIVHFSGHGGADAGLAEGIVVNGSNGNPVVLTSNALGRLFEMAKEYVQCVVLNSCYSNAQAEAIKQHIPHVIGMSDAIEDTSARMFSVGFYEALGVGESYTEAFNSGTLAIEMEGLPGADIPVLL
ncbi:conserved hypothetical protein [Microscilla marina ATCC 23134]|uniref:CHAT domain-containing protein n=2 Tax=Microscilla marina TaxID=1027 RepID=A1ZRS1_MICM2|nr:conserved hypothetical protein [Microscilla marina ATCC 23134]